MAQKWEYLELGYRRTDEYKNNKYDTEHWTGSKWSWADGDKRGAEARLNSLGDEGWELVTAYPEAGDLGPSYAGRTNYIYYLLKRPKS